MSRKGMHLLRRNLTDFEYLPPDGETSDLNDDGEHTGEFYQKSGTPVPKKGNISEPSGSISQNFFGTDTRYTHVLVMDDPDAGISELGMIRWKGDLYEIRAVRPSLNALSVALRKKTANHVEESTNDQTANDDQTPTNDETPSNDESEGE